MRNQKNFVNILWSLFALVSFFVGMPAYAKSTEQKISAVYENIKINMNGNMLVPIDADGNYTEPFISDGTTYLPLRAISNMLNLNVEWEDSTSSIYLTNSFDENICDEVNGIEQTFKERILTIYYRNIKIYINEEEQVLATEQGEVVEPFIYDGTTYLPVRAVSSLLGLSVEWDDENKIVELSSNDEDSVLVFEADFSGDTPSDKQFYSWEDRIYGTMLHDKISNIACYNNQLHLKMQYDNGMSKWLTQMITTAGLFETDSFTCEFKAKFPNVPYAWSGVITYGTGTYWTDGLYSDGIKWPAGGEIDAFEQAGAKTEKPYYFNTPTVHYGPGTESGYPGGDNVISGSKADFDPDEFHIYKFVLENGVITSYIDGKKVGETDASDYTVDNNYLCDYNPFKKAQAFYLSVGASSDSISYVYDNVIDYFRVYQKKSVGCKAIELYPQMWDKNADLVFPTGSELYLERNYYPSDTSNKACKWESSNTEVATVCQGYVRVKSEGEAVITATCGNAKAEYKLTVNNDAANIPCAKLTSSINMLTLCEGEANNNFKIYEYPKFTTEDLYFVSSDESIAVYDNGAINGIRPGKCIICAKCGKQSIEIPVEVTEKGKPYIEYNFTGILDDAFETYKSDRTVNVKNIGLGGNIYDLNGIRLSTDRNSDGSRSDKVLNADTITLETNRFNEIDLENQSLDVVYKGLIINKNIRNKLVSCTINNEFRNYPKLQPYTTDDFKYQLTYYWTDARAFIFEDHRFNVVYHYENGLCSVYVNGKRVVDNDKSNPAKMISIQFKNIANTSYGYNLECYAMYIGNSFTEDELSEMSIYQ